MYEQQICQSIRNMQIQLNNLQGLIINLKGAVSTLSNTRASNNTVTKTVILGVKDISSAQLYDAYKKGLNIQQLVELADGKYTPEQIYKKLQKIGGTNL